MSILSKFKENMDNGLMHLEAEYGYLKNIFYDEINSKTKEVSLMKFTEIDVVQRALIQNKEEVGLLIEYLAMDKSTLSFSESDTLKTATKIIDYLREMGSNDVATFFRGEGVSYSEVVIDVGEKLKADVSSSQSDEENEVQIILKMFADSFDKMSEDEKKELLKSLSLTGSEIPYGAAGTLIAQLLLKQYGGFAFYKTSVIVANFVSKALLGRGLTFAANATLTRSLSLIVGPLGWIASGLWLAIDLAGPAYRKTIPAIVHMAALRQIVKNSMRIGVVGDGAAGKDSLFKAVFGIDTENISPIAGSTKDVEEYFLDDSMAIKLINFPGFNDFREGVNNLISDRLSVVDVFLLVVDVDRGVSGSDIDILNTIKGYSKPILICLNKIDKPKPDTRDSLINTAKKRFEPLDDIVVISTSFDPDERLHQGGTVGVEEVFNWTKNRLEEAGKNTDGLIKFANK